MVGDGSDLSRRDTALGGPVDDDPRHVDESEARLGQHRRGEAGDAADDVDADTDRSAEHDELVGEASDRPGS